jgi:sec-independent protein translocase protein TatA
MGIGPEWLVVILVIVVLFGAKKLPELARSLGRSSSEFKKGLKEGADDDAPTTPNTTPAASNNTPISED